MNYFLAKTEPGEYSINDLERDGVTAWDGVHNFAAIGFIKQMQHGDRVFIYHSVKEKQVVGEAEVVDEPYLNTEDPRTSWAVKLKFVRKFDGPHLADFKNSPELSNFDLVRQSRLSVMKVPEVAVDFILAR